MTLIGLNEISLDTSEVQTCTQEFYQDKGEVSARNGSFRVYKEKLKSWIG